MIALPSPLVILIALALIGMWERAHEVRLTVATIDVATDIEATGLRSSSIARPTLPQLSEDDIRPDRLRRWFWRQPVAAREGVLDLCRWQSQHPCGAMLPDEVGIGPAAPLELLAPLSEPQQQQVRPFCRVFKRPPFCNTPLVVAFAGEAIAFADHWPTSVTPWLALDRDGDGAITSRAELFGDATVLADGHTATNGFLALAELDVNGDGMIDRMDPAFTRLVLWADRDGDHTSTPGELRSAYEVVVEIPLANHRDARCTAEGDCEGERGTFTWRNANGAVQTGAVVDVYLPR